MKMFSPFEYFIQVVSKETKSLLAEDGSWKKPETAYNKARSLQREVNSDISYVQVVMRLRNAKSIMEGN